MKQKLIVVVGPTASGKTGLGVELAMRLGGEIVSADSRQVYCGLDIGTGKEGEACRISDGQMRQVPQKETREETLDYLRSCLRCIEGVPQWLIDIVKPGQRFTLFDWLPLAKMVIEDIVSRGKIPIVVGGTGLYVQALIEGFVLEKVSVVQPGADSLDLNALSLNDLRSMLLESDPEAYDRVDLKNPHRLKRAIERARMGQKPTKVRPDFDTLQIGVSLERNELYRRIDERVDRRFQNGMLDEVVGLVQAGVDQSWLLGLGLEYRIIGSFVLDNIMPVDMPVDETVELLKTLPTYEIMRQELKYKIHAFARRQLVWFRRFPEIVWVESRGDALAVAGRFIDQN